MASRWLFIAWVLAVCFTFSSSFFGPFDDWKGLVFYLGCGVISAIVMIRKREGCRVPGGRIGLACIVFIALSAISLAVAHPPLCEGLAVISKSVLMFAFVWAASRLPDSFIENSFRAMIMIVSAIVMMLLLKFYLPPFIAMENYIIRPIGHISYFSDLVLACIFMVVYRIWRSGYPMRLVWGAAAVILGVGLWMSGTRASMIGFLAGAAAMGLCLIRYRVISPRRFVIWLLAAAVAFSITITANPSAYLRKTSTGDRLESMFKFNIRECSLFLRRVAFFKTKGLVEQRPLLGHGPGSFKFIYPEFAYEGEVHDESKAGQWYMHPHNEILFQMFETGAATTAVLALIIAILCLGSLRRLKASDDRREKIYIACALSGFIAIAASVQFSPSMQFTTTRLVFAMFAAILLRHGIFISGKRRGLMCPRIALVFIICCAALLVTSYHVSLYAAYRAWRSDDRGDRISWSKAADALAPGAFYPLYVRAVMASMYGPPAESERQSLRLYRNYPYVPSVLYMRGAELMREGRMDEAREAARHALANDPNFEAAKELLRRLGPSSKP